MTRRKRRRGEKRTTNGRPAEMAERSPPPGSGEVPPPPAILRPYPPRKNLPLLIVSTVLTLGWIVFLVFMAVGRITILP
jgi:hypothetical protein